MKTTLRRIIASAIAWAVLVPAGATVLPAAGLEDRERDALSVLAWASALWIAAAIWTDLFNRRRKRRAGSMVSPIESLLDPMPPAELLSERGLSTLSGCFRGRALAAWFHSPVSMTEWYHEPDEFTIKLACGCPMTFQVRCAMAASPDASPRDRLWLYTQDEDVYRAWNERSDLLGPLMVLLWECGFTSVEVGAGQIAAVCRPITTETELAASVSGEPWITSYSGAGAPSRRFTSVRSRMPRVLDALEKLASALDGGRAGHDAPGGSRAIPAGERP